MRCCYLATRKNYFFVRQTRPKTKQDVFWLMLATGVALTVVRPFISSPFAPAPGSTPLNRYDFEAWRHWHLIDDVLAHQPYMMGHEYLIVDMSVWGWARVVPFVLGAWKKLPPVKRSTKSTHVQRLSAQKH
jgi:GST-like protein